MGQFEQDLQFGNNLITSIAKDRWSIDQFLHPQKNYPGTQYSDAAGSVGDVSQFDASFFGISPREAAQIDPQQRLLLELSWQAFEDAGIKPSTLRGSRCGVYIGIASADYSYRLAEDLASIDANFATGNTASISANRISYFFDLHGPSMAIDTACSSSLVAFHQACQAIKSGEITHALTGGISLHLHPYGFIVFSKASMLSPHGQCNVFDESSDGYVRSEGGGMFLLKDYDLAVADGDRIFAVVAQTSVNTDGKKSGLTIPKPQAQAQLLDAAYSAAGIAPQDISYIEAHGTGTAVGDPIETLALGLSIGQKRDSDKPLPIGSVKSNLGHLEAASGIAGLIKALYVIKHRKIPATIGIKKLNSRINFKELNLDVVTETRDLPFDRPTIVGVNSFGFGGANAHVILQNVDNHCDSHCESLTNHVDRQTSLPFLISAATPTGLMTAASELAQALVLNSESNSVEKLTSYDVAYQLAFRREKFEHCAVVFGHELESICKQLFEFADGLNNTDVLTGKALIYFHNSAVQPSELTSATNGPAFFYSGNGSQWLGMGRALLADEIFKSAIEEIDQHYVQLAGYSIHDQLLGLLPDLDYTNTHIAQPALFAIQVGITRMLAKMGLKPSAVVGHSVGEVAAAWAAGILDLKTATEVIYHRSRLQQTTKGRGNMTAVAINADTAHKWLQEENLSDQVFIAGINSYRGITLAGGIEQLALFESRLAKERIGFKRLDLDYAFHSPAMDDIEIEIQKALAKIEPQTGSVPFYSTVMGNLIDGSELTANYWWKNIRQSVLFESATNAVLDAGHQVLVEIGPNPVLRGYLNDCVNQNSDSKSCSCTVLSSVSKTRDQIEDVQAIMAYAWIAGAEIDLEAFFPVKGKHVTLPGYPWQKERHWHQVSSESPNTLNSFIEHPLLGRRIPQHDLLWECRLDSFKHAFLKDHVVGEAVVFPGTGYVELALAAAHSWHTEEVKLIQDLEILAPITFSSSFGKVLRVAIDPADGQVTIKSRDLLSAEGWTLNAKARIILQAQFTNTDCQLLDQLSTRIPDFDGESHLGLTRQVGLQYGDAFNAISHGWLDFENGQSSVIALFAVPDSIAACLSKYHLHPALLDCSFQLIIQMLREFVDLSEEIAFIPTQIGQITLRSETGIPHLVRAKLLRRLPHSILAEFTLFDAQGNLIAKIDQARFKRTRLQKSVNNEIQCVRTALIPQPLQPGLEESSIKYLHILEATNELARRGIIDRHYRNYVDELDPLLEVLCSSYAFDALIELGFNEDPSNNEILMDALTSSLRKAQPELIPYFNHIIKMCLDDEKLIETPEGLRVANAEINNLYASENDLNQAERIDTQGLWNTLIADYPDFFRVIHTVGQVGQHLAQLLKCEKKIDSVLGSKSTLAHLMNDLMSNVYQSKLNEIIFEKFNKRLQHISPRQRIGLLEVSAFKPVVSYKIATHLQSDQTDLVFACADLLGLENKSHLIESCVNIKFDCIDQSIETKQIDSTDDNYRVDLAIVWLHFETAELNNKAIDYAIKHLKPGGTLLVIGLHRTPWLDFAFGAQNSWWLNLGDVKSISMQRDRAMWEHRLASLGLLHVRHMDCTHDVTAGSYLLVAQNPSTATQPEARHAQPRSWLLFDDDSNVNQYLRDSICAKLQEHGDIVSVLSHQEDALDIIEITKHIEIMQSHFGEIDGVIHIKGIGQSLGTTEMTSAVDRCMNASMLIKAVQATNISAPIWFITQNAHSGDLRLSVDAILTGFVLSMMNEVTSNRIKLIDLNSNSSIFSHELIDGLIDEITLGSAETEVVLTKDRGRYVPRLKQENKGKDVNKFKFDVQRQTVQLNFSQPGQLRNLQWQAISRQNINDDEVEIEVEATGLNFRDVMYALGLLSDEAIENGFAGATIGLECAGKITKLGKNIKQFEVGDRVVGFGPACFANRVVTKVNAISYIPRSISAEAAATIPSTFLTSYYALVHLGRLEPGEKILIHGAAGGVGLAAIQIARWCGAEIFATAGSDEKRDFLRMMGVDHVLDSRSLKFADDILTITHGEGIDMVLNSLAGEAINRNLSVLKPFGRFLELGKRDFYENTRIGLRPFRKNITYFGIDADQLMNERPDLTTKLFSEVMNLFEKGILHALPYTQFEAGEVVDAFRYMQQSQQIGKIVVTYRNGIPDDLILDHSSNRHDKTVNAQKSKSLELDPNAAYLVTGGLGGFGLKTALWLAEKGARHLILLGRRGCETDEAKAGISNLQAMNVNVTASPCDITDLAQLTATLDPYISKLKGVIHAAAIIEDCLIDNLTSDQLDKVLSPKIKGALNLHLLTQNLGLDFFVMYSSATTLFGNPGQAAYVAANAGLEALGDYRRAQGLVATCMLWGAIDDAGFLARNKHIKEALQHRMGGRPITSAEALNKLEAAILNQNTNDAVMDLDFSALSKFLPTAKSPKFDLLRRNLSDLQQEQQHFDDIPRMLLELDHDALITAFMEMVKNELSQILRIDPDKIDTNKSIYDMGLDSLMGVELVVALEARFGTRLPVMAISENPNIEKLTKRLIDQLRAKDEHGNNDTSHQESELIIKDVANQHGAEASAEQIKALAESISNQSNHEAGRFLQ